MLSFDQPIYSVFYPGSPRYSAYTPYPSPRPMVADPQVGYRRALAEYLFAEEEYEALLRAREQAKLRARVEEALRRQERARLLRAEIFRARREQQAWELERTLAKTLSREEGLKDHRSFRDIAPVICGTSGQPRQDTLAFPFLQAHASRTGEAGPEKESPESFRGISAVRSSAEDRPQPQQDANEDTNHNKPQPLSSEPDEYSVPNLESLLRERLQKVVGDEEVQDVTRAILRHLAPETGVSPSTKANTCWTQPEGCDLSRSDALRGAAAEAAKESFRAHRAEVAKREEPSAPSPTSKSAPSSLKVIQDIRSALAKLSSGFSFPPSLDFTDDGLAFTPANAPLRVYEHALDGLLAQLDAVESDGDEGVRVERRAAVKEVEKAIEDVARRVTEAREGEKQGKSVDAAISPEDDPAKNKDEGVVVLAEPSADGPFSSSSEDRLDPGFLSPEPQPEASSPQNTEVVLPHDMTPSISDPITGEEVLRDQSTSPASESIPQAVSVATPTVTPTDQVVVSSVPSDDSFVSKQGASADQETTDQSPSAPLESSASATPQELPVEVSTAIPGAIAPSSTPVYPTLTSPDINEDLLASLGHAPVFLSQGPEGEDDLESDSSSVDAADEREWIEVGEP